ncbi:hypothetical protein GZH53_13240 [Flavihumibacter sp. R14]|nr:hypothetical protein [Flavihumibacter soli]
MKNVLVSLFFLALVSCGEGSDHNRKINIVNVSAFSFFNVKSGNSIPLSATEGNITFAFGEPATIRSAAAKGNSYPCSRWIYNGASINIKAGRMVDFIVNTGDFGCAFNGTVIKVGENVSRLKSIFPNSYSAKSPNKMLVGMHFNGEPIESRIQFDYNSENHITAIILMN